MVEANIRPPSDSRLLADSVRVLARTILRAQALLRTAGQKIQSGFEDGTQQAKRLARQIGETLRSKKEAAQNAGKQAYQKLLHLTEQTIVWAEQTQKQLKKQSEQRAKRLAETLAHFGPLAQRVILPQRGHRSSTRLKHEHKAWFVKGRHWQAGLEGRIRVLKRAHNFDRCLAHGLDGFHCWVGWGVIAGNLAVLGRT